LNDFGLLNKKENKKKKNFFSLLLSFLFSLLQKENKQNKNVKSDLVFYVTCCLRDFHVDALKRVQQNQPHKPRTLCCDKHQEFFWVPMRRRRSLC
jgi:hypothetical protein